MRMKKLDDFLRYLKHQKNKVIKIALLVSFILDLLFVLVLQRMDTMSELDNQFQAGTVATKDIVADTDIQYIDSNAMSIGKREMGEEGNLQPLAGAVLELTPVTEDIDLSKTVIEKYTAKTGDLEVGNYELTADKLKWKSSSEDIKIGKLLDGTYKLTETATPDNSKYKVITTFEFDYSNGTVSNVKASVSTEENDDNVSKYVNIISNGKGIEIEDAPADDKTADVTINKQIVTGQDDAGKDITADAEATFRLFVDDATDCSNISNCNRKR